MDVTHIASIDYCHCCVSHALSLSLLRFSLLAFFSVVFGDRLTYLHCTYF